MFRFARILVGACIVVGSLALAVSDEAWAVRPPAIPAIEVEVPYGSELGEPEVPMGSEFGEPELPSGSVVSKATTLLAIRFGLVGWILSRSVR